MQKKVSEPLRRNPYPQRGRAPLRTLFLFLAILSFQVMLQVIDSTEICVQIEVSLWVPETQVPMAGGWCRQGDVDEEPDEVWESPAPQELPSADP